MTHETKLVAPCGHHVCAIGFNRGRGAQASGPIPGSAPDGTAMESINSPKVT